MTNLNYLGTYASIAALWEALPEGGNEGDFALIGSTYYGWDKYARQWAETEAPSETPEEPEQQEEEETTAPAAESTGFEDANNLGEFETLEAVWEAVPEGGQIGDTVTIDGTLYRWDATARNWSAGEAQSATPLAMTPLGAANSTDINYLGTFASIDDVWIFYPEGGHEGDYVVVDATVYSWNTLQRAWTLSENTIITIEYLSATPSTSTRINYIGAFTDLESVWEAFPEGGYEGDYVHIDGYIRLWNKSVRNWSENDNPGTPAIEGQEVEGDLTVTHNLYVGGMVSGNELEIDNPPYYEKDEVDEKIGDAIDDLKDLKLKVDSQTVGTYNPKQATTLKITREQLRQAAGIPDWALNPTAPDTDHAHNADQWDGHEFDDYMDQPVRTTDDVTFAKVTTPRVESPQFSEGALGAGFRLWITQQGYAELEVDDITVRRTMKVFEMIIQQLKHQGGMYIYSAAALECTSVTEISTGYICYFDTKDGQIPNEFVAGDQARCQRFNLGTTELKYYWRLVTAVGDDYIVLSKEDCDAGSGVPEAGDNIIQLGNRTNTARQAAKLTTTIDNSSPRDDYYKGINSYDLTGKLVTTVGVKDGEVGVWTENGEFKGRVTITGGGGLNSLAEWNDMSYNVSSAWAEALAASAAAGAAQGTANQAILDAATADAAADAAQAAADALGTKLNNWASDSYISPVEKEALRQQKADVAKEYSEIISRANRYEVGTTAYTAAYALASAALTKYTAATPELIAVESDYANIADYYDARATLLIAIAAAEEAATQSAKSAADAAQRDADAAQAAADAAAIAADAAQTAADNAQADATAANTKLSNWGADDKISPVEKEALRQQSANIASEHTAIVQEADKYNIPVSTFNAAYNAAATALAKYTAATPEVISVGADYADIAAYYTARATIAQSIATAAAKASSDAQSAADAAQATADAAAGAAAGAQASANQALSRAAALEAAINAINSDTVLDLVEKNVIRTQWVVINGTEDLGRTGSKGSYLATKALAALYGNVGAREVITYNSVEVTYGGEHIYYNVTGTAALDMAYIALREFLRGVGLNDRENVFDGFDRNRFATLLTDYSDAEIRVADNVNRSLALAMTAFQDAVQANIDEMQGQLDNTIDYWFASGVPTTSNYPASNWNTAALKKDHIGDVYYDEDSGKGYRWQVNASNVYYWNLMQDDAATRALALAQQAKDTADGKRRVFLSQPGTGDSYDEGDIWMHATIGSYTDEMLVCRTSKAAGTAFSVAHWTTATKYTDDTVALAAQQAASNAATVANAAQAAADAATATANAAKTTADAAHTQLTNWADDQKISPVEKEALRQQKANVVSEHTALAAEATAYGLSVTAFNSAYDAAITAFNKYTASSPEVISITSDYNDIAAYFTARATIAQAIADAAKAAAATAQSAAETAQAAANVADGKAVNAKNAADAAQATADAAASAASAAQTTANNAKTSADNANTALQNWASDSYISPVEKEALRQQKADVISEHTAIAAEAISYGISVTAFTAAYNAAITAFNKYTASSPELIAVGTDYADIAAYFTARAVIAQSIAEKSKEAADAAAQAAEAAQTAADDAIGAARDAMAAADAVAEALAGIDLDTKLDEAEKANIRVIWTRINGIPSTGSAGRGGTYHAAKVTLTEEGRVGLKTEITYKNVTVTYNGEHIYYNVLGEARLDAAYLALREYLNGCQINAPGEFNGFDRDKYAELVRDYDVALDQVFQILSDVAKQAADAAQAKADAASLEAQAAQTAANNAQTKANQAYNKAGDVETAVGIVASDGWITPAEKVTLKRQLDDINAEHTAFVQEAGKYSINVDAFNSAKNGATSVLSYYTAAATWNNNTQVSNNYPLSNITAYFNARATLAQSIATAAKAAVVQAQTDANSANEGIRTINDVLTNFTADDYISPMEKRTLKQALDDEVGNHSAIAAQAGQFLTQAAINTIGNATLTNTLQSLLNTCNAKYSTSSGNNAFRNVILYYTQDTANPNHSSTWAWEDTVPVSNSYPLTAIPNYYTARDNLVDQINICAKTYAEKFARNYTDAEIQSNLQTARQELIGLINTGDGEALAAASAAAAAAAVADTKAGNAATAAANAQSTASGAASAAAQVASDAIMKVELFGTTTITGGHIKSEFINVTALAADAGFINALTVNKLRTNSGKVVIEADGSITATDVNLTGTITATSGRFEGTLISNSGSIGGFTISNGYIGTERTAQSPDGAGMSLYNDFIFFRDYDTGYYHAAFYEATIGANTLSAMYGYRSLTRFVADGSEGISNINTGKAIGVLSSIKGFADNWAWYCPEGIFVGFRPRIAIHSNGKSLDQYDTVILCENNVAVGFYLPSEPKEGQFYAIIHATRTTLNVYGSTTHPILRVTNGNAGTSVVASADSGSMETILLAYIAKGSVTYNGASRTGFWTLTYLKVS